MSAENTETTVSLIARLPERLPPEFYTALDALNRGEYFACHETLEALWIPEKRSVRQIYQGVLQIAVGCYHLVERRNWVGAVNKLDAGARRLERLGLGVSDETAAYGVDWSCLIADADRLQAHLRALGREDVARFDRALLPVAIYA
jgi:predicted metal-dependent hydrolase